MHLISSPCRYRLLAAKILLEALLVRALFTSQVELNIELVMLDLDVLVHGTLRTVGPLAGVDRAAVVSLDLVGSSPKPLLFVILVPLPFLDFLSLLF